MTKKQYLKVIESIVKSPRNDLQKIAMLKYSFEAYVDDSKKQILEIIQAEIEGVKHNFPFTHDDEVKLGKLTDIYGLIQLLS